MENTVKSLNACIKKVNELKKANELKNENVTIANHVDQEQEYHKKTTERLLAIWSLLVRKENEKCHDLVKMIILLMDSEKNMEIVETEKNLEMVKGKITETLHKKIRGELQNSRKKKEEFEKRLNNIITGIRAIQSYEVPEDVPNYAPYLPVISVEHERAVEKLLPKP
ncbi:hypothetical protein CAEBREN_20779 [Caenorhabditis brenneri]|uniref:Uncharacterized protein n=1 Tax=Caenorhabditis brenneri TaxID=135651 RepID=G0MFP0_CAEBE|nr:hypothetical protein CAEBREN_20779 [Caenorhabditis brenneri]